MPTILSNIVINNMSRSASGPSAPNPTNKRHRGNSPASGGGDSIPADFDDSADPSIGASVPTSYSPTAAAKAELEAIAETLPEDVRPSALKHGALCLKAFTAHKTKCEKLQAMKDNADVLPRSCRFKVKADVLPEVRSGPEFQAREEAFQAAVVKAGLDCKEHIMSFTNMNAHALQKRFHQSIVTAFHAVTELLLAYYNQESYGVAKMLRDYLISHEVSFIAAFKFSIARFSQLYREKYSVDVLPSTTNPNSTAQAAVAVPATPGAQNQLVPYVTPTNNRAAPDATNDAMQTEENPVPPLLHNRLEINKVLDGLSDMILLATVKYTSQQEIAARKVRMKNAQSRQANTAHTSETKKILDGEINASPETIQALIKQSVASAMKSRDAEITSLKQALNSKNGPAKNGKGAGGGALKQSTQATPPSTSNQQRGRGRQAGGSAGGTQTNARQRGNNRSKSRSKQSGGKSRKRRNGRSGASGQN